METQPTPYDIPQIPYFPFVPPLAAWIVIFAALLLILLLYRMSPNLSIPRAKLKAFLLAIKELEQIKLAGEVRKDLLERAGSVIRILIASIAPDGSDLKRIRELGPEELAKLSEKEESRPLQNLLLDLKELSLLAYRPEKEVRETKPEIFGRLLNNLRMYEEEWRLVIQGKKQ